MTAAKPLQPGDPGRLGDYRLTGRLGLGGQGVVFLGRRDTGPPVAVKLLHAQPMDEPAAAERFLGEMEIARRVPALGTAQILDAGVATGRPYVVSEYVEGPSLHRLVSDEGPRSRRIMERLALGTTTALTAIHGAGVRHGDLTPANVLLGLDGPRVSDYGVGRALATAAAVPGHLVGAPAFMAPEQLTGTDVGPAADVFAWGLSMVFAATGAPAFGEAPAPEVMRRVLHDEPVLTAVPESLRDLVAGALSKDPALRPTAYQLLTRLLELPGMPDAVIAMAIEARERATPAETAAAPPEAYTPPGSSSDTLFIEDVLPGFTTEPAAPAPRRHGRTLPVVGSITLGVLAGVAAITLVLWPQLRGAGGKDHASAIPARSAPANRPVDSVPAAFGGSWRGTATNERGARFPVRVDFTAGRTTAEIRYPAPINCTGTLRLTEGTQARLTMALKVGRPCTNGGSVTVTSQAGGSLDYAWAKPGTTLNYRATLSKFSGT